MDRWTTVFKTHLNPARGGAFFTVAASLCLSPSSQTLPVPSVNAIFFGGDRVQGTGNPVIERLSDGKSVAQLLARKLGPCANVWVVEASTYNEGFAVYKEFVPTVDSWGDPKSYDPMSIPAFNTTLLLLSKCLEQASSMLSSEVKKPLLKDMQAAVSASIDTPRTIFIGFSKGGAVINQLLVEFAELNVKSATSSNEKEELPTLHYTDIVGRNQVFPTSMSSFLRSISEFHYVDVGLNKDGAYLTDQNVINKISENLHLLDTHGIRILLHGTPRQWCDERRPWIRDEKNRLVELLEAAAYGSEGKLQVTERFYFADKPRSLQMHFEIIASLDLS